MPPNFGDMPPFDPESAPKDESTKIEAEMNKSDDYYLEVFRWGLNSLAHTLIGITVAMCLWFALRNILTTPLTATQQHIALCVVGYQLMMAEAILCFSSGNGWTHPFKLKHKRLLHWLMQLAGSGLALWGSVTIMISRSPSNFGSNHGIFGLLAMICTIISVVNGLASLYAFELRVYMNANFSKLGHIIFGSSTIIFSTVCLCLGFDKNSFKNWASPEFTYVLMGMTGIFTLVVLFNPLLSFGGRVKSLTSR